MAIRSAKLADRIDHHDAVDSKQQWDTHHEYQVTDNPYQYTSRYVDNEAGMENHL